MVLVLLVQSLLFALTLLSIFPILLTLQLPRPRVADILHSLLPLSLIFQPLRLLSLPLRLLSMPLQLISLPYLLLFS